MLEHEKHAGAFILRSATNLAGEDRDNLSDPYCLVFWNGRRIGRTLIITNTLEPQWDACFNLSELIGAVDPESENVLRIEVWDWDREASTKIVWRNILERHADIGIPGYIPNWRSVWFRNLKNKVRHRHA